MRHLRNRLPRLERDGAPALAVLAIVLAAAGGCGGGGDDGGASTAPAPAGTDSVPAAATGAAATGAPDDKKLISAAINAVFASGDPVAACETYATASYVATAFGDLSGCRAAQSSGAAARSVLVSKVKISEGSAAAVAVPTGGANSGERIDLTLVRDGAAWKVDSGHANVPVGP